MYYISKKLEIAGSHQLSLNYESKCQNLHGHNWQIVVHCKSETLNPNGMVCDFTKIKRVVGQLDHRHINDVLDLNPTAENIARWIVEQIPTAYKCEVQESNGNTAIYES